MKVYSSTKCFFTYKAVKCESTMTKCPKLAWRRRRKKVDRKVDFNFDLIPSHFCSRPEFRTHTHAHYILRHQQNLPIFMTLHSIPSPSIVLSDNHHSHGIFPSTSYTPGKKRIRKQSDECYFSLRSSAIKKVELFISTERKKKFLLWWSCKIKRDKRGKQTEERFFVIFKTQKFEGNGRNAHQSKIVDEVSRDDCWYETFSLSKFKNFTEKSLSF